MPGMARLKERPSVWTAEVDFTSQTLWGYSADDAAESAHF